MKSCNRCFVEKPLTEFYPDVRLKGGYYNQCKTCRSVHAKAYAASDERRLAETAKHYKRKYGITMEEFTELLASQNGVCKICKKDYSRKTDTRLCVDHDHTTGAVRGILCHRCNTALGLFKDNVELLAAATNYLRGE